MDIFIHYNTRYWILIMILFTVTFWHEKSLRMTYSAIWSLVYLLLVDWVSCCILFTLSLFTWWTIKQEKVSGTKAVWSSVVVFTVLMYYKVTFVNKDLSIFSSKSLIPLGLSYYTLRCIHVIAERYKGNIKQSSYTDILSYLFYLPTLWVGPIHRFPQFSKESRRHRWESKRFLEGLERLLYGYFKVCFVTELVLNQTFTDWIEHYGFGEWTATYLQMVNAGLTLYMQFSGYSDVAIGFSLLLGIRVMENFKFPYFQKNISDFWKSWHISLTSWCQEYIYNPVIAKARSPQLAVICSILVMALWHEVSLRYILWACYHALGILIWQFFHTHVGCKPRVQASRLMGVFSRVLTLNFVWLGFLLVRQPDVQSMLHILKKLFYLT